MLVEHTEIIVKDGAENDFMNGMTARGKLLLESVDGVISVQFGPGVENPSKFLLLIVWTSMASHAAYNSTPACAEIRQLISPCAASASMEHFELC